MAWPPPACTISQGPWPFPTSLEPSACPVPSLWDDSAPCSHPDPIKCIFMELLLLLPVSPQAPPLWGGFPKFPPASHSAPLTCCCLSSPTLGCNHRFRCADTVSLPHEDRALLRQRISFVSHHCRPDSGMVRGTQ